VIAAALLLLASVSPGCSAGADGTARGKALYARHCAGCHGPQGRGDGYRILGADQADLLSATSRQEADASLLNTIHEGNGTMPAWGGRLSDDQVHDVVAYIRALQGTAQTGRNRRLANDQH
jgi:mono/diheme cytochrome c family protein